MTFYRAACTISEKVASGVAHPYAQIGFIAACALWLLCGGSVAALTLVLSILAITLTQMVLLSQDRITRAEHQKLDAIIAGTDADDAVAGIEKQEDT